MFGVLLLSFVALSTVGCANKASNYNGKGIVYGCDGSGAGVVLRWGPSARKGAREAGYEGVFESFRWQTGLGVAADHASSVSYKKKAGRKLAEQITAHARTYPDDPIYVGALSAGCAVAIYALEALPQDVTVDQVFLLSSSVSATYDLSDAMQHVNGKVYVYYSPRDMVLKDLATVVGTADRRNVGDDISGLRGFRPPPGAAVGLYREKLVNIGWRSEFASYGHKGGHTDVVASPFVAKFIGPTIKPAR